MCVFESKTLGFVMLSCFFLVYEYCLNISSNQDIFVCFVALKKKSHFQCYFVGGGPIFPPHFE